MAVSQDCAICSDGYSAQLGFACSECLGAASGIVLASFLLVVIVFGAVAVASYVVLDEGADKRKGLVERVARFIPLQSLKIVIVSWQILTQVRAVARAETAGDEVLSAHIRTPLRTQIDLRLKTSMGRQVAVAKILYLF